MTTPDDDTLEFIRATLGTIVPFATHVGVLIDHVGDGTATATLPERAELANHVSTVHAAALFTAAEAASGAAMAGATAPFVTEAHSVVKHASVRYHAPATGPITATATSGRTGADIRDDYATNQRTEFIVHVELSDTDERRVADMEFQWVVRAPRR